MLRRSDSQAGVRSWRFLASTSGIFAADYASLPRLVEAERAVISTLADGGDVRCELDCLSPRL